MTGRIDPLRDVRPFWRRWMLRMVAWRIKRKFR
jgi:hypothetical protein